MFASPPVLFISVASPPGIAKSLPSATPAPTASASKPVPVKAPPVVSASVIPYPASVVGLPVKSANAPGK